jgi:branched-chain amino acid aminotransferase
MSAGAFPFEANPHPVAAERRAELLSDPGFGRVFTDHMVTIRYAEGKGWHDAKVAARAPLTLDPATAVLHYAQEIFEGLKAYRLADGGMALFRPEQNARRFQRSAKRLAMPELPEELLRSIRIGFRRSKAARSTCAHS